MSCDDNLHECVIKERCKWFREAVDWGDGIYLKKNTLIKGNDGSRAFDLFRGCWEYRKHNYGNENRDLTVCVDLKQRYLVVIRMSKRRKAFVCFLPLCTLQALVSQLQQLPHCWGHGGVKRLQIHHAAPLTLLHSNSNAPTITLMMKLHQTHRCTTQTSPLWVCFSLVTK